MGRIYNDSGIGQVLLKKSPVSRRISIRVHPVDGVTILVPETFSYDEGLRFFMLKRDWVVKTMEKQRRRIESAKESGMAVPSLGDGVSVRTLMSEIIFRRESAVVDGASAGVSTVMLEDVKITGRTFLSLDRPIFRKTVTYSGNLPEEGSDGLDEVLKPVLVEVLKTEARLILPRKLAFFSSRFGFSFGKVAIKHNASNWGSCSARGNINLNLNLVRLPEPLCDCVILHELSHLRHPDHGQGFHSLLEKLCTDNVARLAMTADPYLPELVRKINSSRSSQPVHSVMERELKKYRLV